MNEYKIEKNIPIPELNPRKSGLTRVFRQMEIGDSVLLSADDVMSLTRVSKDAGVKVTRRIEGDGYRVWRIE